MDVAPSAAQDSTPRIQARPTTALIVASLPSLSLRAHSPALTDLSGSTPPFPGSPCRPPGGGTTAGSASRLCLTAERLPPHPTKGTQIRDSSPLRAVATTYCPHSANPHPQTQREVNRRPPCASRWPPTTASPNPPPIPSNATSLPSSRLISRPRRVTTPIRRPRRSERSKPSDLPLPRRPARDRHKRASGGSVLSAYPALLQAGFVALTRLVAAQGPPYQ